MNVLIQTYVCELYETNSLSLSKQFTTNSSITIHSTVQHIQTTVDLRICYLKEYQSTRVVKTNCQVTAITVLSLPESYVDSTWYKVCTNKHVFIIIFIYIGQSQQKAKTASFRELCPFGCHRCILAVIFYFTDSFKFIYLRSLHSMLQKAS